MPAWKGGWKPWKHTGRVRIRQPSQVTVSATKVSGRPSLLRAVPVKASSTGTVKVSCDLTVTEPPPPPTGTGFYGYPLPGTVGAELNGQPAITTTVSALGTAIGYTIDDAYLASHGNTVRDLRVHGQLNIDAPGTSTVNIVNVHVINDLHDSRYQKGIRIRNIATNGTVNISDCTIAADIRPPGPGSGRTAATFGSAQDACAGDAIMPAFTTQTGIQLNVSRCEITGFSKLTFGGAQPGWSTAWTCLIQDTVFRQSYPFWISATTAQHRGTVFVQGSNCVLRRCWLAANDDWRPVDVNTNPGGFEFAAHTGTLMQFSSGTYTGIVIENCFITGGGYIVRFESATGVALHARFQNNVVGPYSLSIPWSSPPSDGDDYFCGNNVYFPTGSWTGNIRGDTAGVPINTAPTAGQVDAQGRRLLIPAPPNAHFE